MLQDMEGRLNQIQSSVTLRPDNKALTYELFFSFPFHCYLLKLHVFNLQREVWNERVNVCVWNVGV